jgi:enamine deaminase RidA (YjgF/YER057c/UK114 family)
MPPAAPGAYEPASDPLWKRAAQFVNACRALGFENPAIVGGLANPAWKIEIEVIACA